MDRRDIIEPVVIDAVGVADAVAQVNRDEGLEPLPALRLIIGGAQLLTVDGTEPRIEARVDADRWVNEGGSLAAEPSALLRVVT